MTRKTRLLPLLVAGLVLAGCVTETEAGGSTAGSVRVSDKAPIVIFNDDGGNVAGYIARRNQLERSGRRVEIRGYCASACTMLTTLPNACLGPKSMMAFHAPHFIGTNIPATMMIGLMGNYYRNGVLKKWNSTWSKSLKMTKISAREYVRLDPQTKLCAR